MTRLRRDSGKATCRKRPESDGKTDSVGSKTSGDRPNVVEHGGSPSEYRRVFEDASKQQDIQKSQYWLTRIVLLRSLGLVYAIAFLVALNQNKYLIGRKGLLPAHLFLREVKRYAGGVNAQAVFQVPTLLWFLEHMGTDSFLDGVASLGFLLALGVTVTGIPLVGSLSSWRLAFWPFFSAPLWPGSSFPAARHHPGSLSGHTAGSSFASCSALV